MKKKIFITVILLFFLIQTYSQSFYNGIVMDSLNNVPLPYITVKIKNTKKGTYSNSNGKFQLTKLKDVDTIVFSAIGYKTQEVPFDLKKDTVRLSQYNIQLDEVVIKQYQKKGKWEKIFERKEVALINAVLFEGTTIRRKVTNLNEDINGLRFFLIDPTQDLSITLRPIVSDIKGNTLLKYDYVDTYHLKKGKNKKITYTFKEDVNIPPEGGYLGIEVIDAPNNQNYKNNVQIECSSDEVSFSEVITVFNYSQEDGKIHNFDKKIKDNLYLEIKVTKR